MTPHLIDLDHIMIGVRSHEEAITAFERLGFCVRGVRPLAPMGGGPAGGIGGSAAILFKPAAHDAANYLELAYFDERFGAPMMRPILAGRAGGAMLVHATADAKALHAEWTRRNIGLLPLIEVDLAAVKDGGRGQRLRIILPDATQPLFCNACEYQDLSEFQNPALTGHDNGVVCWTSVIVADSPDALVPIADHLSRVYDMVIEGSARDGRFRLRNRAVELMAHTHYAARFPSLAGMPPSSPIRAVRLSAGDLASLERRLREAGIPFGWSADARALCVAGTGGTCIDLIFEEAQR